MAHALKQRAIAALAAAAILAAAPALAGCSKVGSQTSVASGNAKPGVVRIIGFGSIDSLIPQLSGNASAADMAMFWGAWLFRVGAHGELVPELATRVPTLANGGISKDGLTITYQLRKGVRWQDGAPFDARDVIFSWHAMMNPMNNVLTRSGYDRIASMSAPDPYTVIVRMRQPYAPAIATFFGPSLAPACILPAHLLAGLPDINRAAYDRKPVGTGPFIVDRYDAQNDLVLRANPHYWRGPPKLDEVHILIVPDPNTRVLMMKSGEADLFDEPAANLVPELTPITGVHTIDTLFNEFWYLSYNARHPPLDDVRVRRAISMAVDRAEVIKSIADGIGTPADGDQPPYSWAYDPHVRAPSYDPAAAGALLTAAGWTLSADGYRYKSGKKLSLDYVTSSGYGEGRRFGPLFQVEMKRVGIDVQLKLYPTSVLFAAKNNGGIMNNGRYDVAWTGWIGGVDPDDATLWSCDQMPPNGYNFAYLCDPRIDAQERIALTTFDQDVRRKAYWRIQELLAEDQPADFLFWARLRDAMSDQLSGFEPSPTVSAFSNPWEWRI